MGLSACKHLCSREVLEVLVVSNYVDLMLSPFEVVPPNFEAFEYGEQLLAMGAVVTLSVGKGAGVESNGVDVAIRG